MMGIFLFEVLTDYGCCTNGILSFVIHVSIFSCIKFSQEGLLSEIKCPETLQTFRQTNNVVTYKSKSFKKIHFILEMAIIDNSIC